MTYMRSSISFGFIGLPNDAPAIIASSSTFSHLRFMDTPSSQTWNHANLPASATRPQRLRSCVRFRAAERRLRGLSFWRRSRRVKRMATGWLVPLGVSAVSNTSTAQRRAAARRIGDAACILTKSYAEGSLAQTCAVLREGRKRLLDARVPSLNFSYDLPSVFVLLQPSKLCMPQPIDLRFILHLFIAWATKSQDEGCFLFGLRGRRTSPFRSSGTH